MYSANYVCTATNRLSGAQEKALLNTSVKANDEGPSTGDEEKTSHNEQVIDGVRATDEPMPLFEPPDEVIHCADDLRNAL